MDQKMEVNGRKDAFQTKEGKENRFVLSCFYLFVFVVSVVYLGRTVYQIMEEEIQDRDMDVRITQVSDVG